MEDMEAMRREKALTIHRLLVQEYGQRIWRRRGEPLEVLVSTVLSQNTSDVNRDRAYRRLRERFPTWEAVRDGPVEEIAEAIRPGGLAGLKAPRLKEILRAITERRGELSLDFLGQMEVEEAKAWLTSLRGVGPKTAACVLLFALGKPAFPVDTHVHRVSRRLGLIEPGTSAPEAEKILEGLLPPENYYPFHLNLIAHGREICKAPRPLCHICVLAPHCDYFNSSKSESPEGS